MNAAQLHEITKHALEVTGEPFWASSNATDWAEKLSYVEDGPEDFWALVSFDGETSSVEDCIEVELDQAVALVKEHLRTWLLAHGWQVQVTCRQDKHSWRLADCLSSLDGGGDRLDAEYPHGDDELTVLCRSVRAVAQADTRYRAAGP